MFLQRLKIVGQAVLAGGTGIAIAFFLTYLVDRPVGHFFPKWVGNAFMWLVVALFCIALVSLVVIIIFGLIRFVHWLFIEPYRDYKKSKGA